MALAEILDAIRSETDARIATLEREAAERAAVIRVEGARAAAAAETELADARRDEAAWEADRIRNRARLQVDRDVRMAREAIVQRVFAEVENKLVELCRSGEYVAAFERFASEAANALPAAAIAHVKPGHAAIARAALPPTIEIIPDLDSAGGLVLESTDGRRAHNTVELRLERATPHLRRLIAEAVPALGARLS